MAWCHQATSHYLNQYWPSSMSPYGITRPQWVNSIYIYKLTPSTILPGSNLDSEPLPPTAEQALGSWPQKQFPGSNGPGNFDWLGPYWIPWRNVAGIEAAPGSWTETPGKESNSRFKFKCNILSCCGPEQAIRSQDPTFEIPRINLPYTCKYVYSYHTQMHFHDKCSLFHTPTGSAHRSVHGLFGFTKRRSDWVKCVRLWHAKPIVTYPNKHGVYPAVANVTSIANVT